MDETLLFMPQQICHGHWIEKERSITWFDSLLEGDESTALLRDMNVAKKEETGTRIFSSHQEGEVLWQ